MGLLPRRPPGRAPGAALGRQLPTPRSGCAAWGHLELCLEGSEPAVRVPLLGSSWHPSQLPAPLALLM